MAFNLKVKTNTAAPASGALSVGELGYNTIAKQVFIGNGVGSNATPVIMAVEGTNIAKVDGIKLSSTFSDAGNIFFSDYEGVPQVTLSENVTMAIGIDSVLKAYNYTGATLTDGQFVYDNGNQDGATTIALARADNLISSLRLIGCITEPIENEDFGFISRGGYVSNVIVDPAIFNDGDIIYLSPTVAGGFTNQKPTAPNYITELGFIDLVSTNSSTADGRIFVKINIIPLADDISYDNSDAFLTSQTVKGALDELSLNKVDVGALSSNISLYPTTATSDISGYYRMVSSTEDADYNDTAVNVATGSITTTNQLISSLVADPNLFIGNPGVINITTLGNIRKTAGNANAYAEFFFRIYHRTAAGVETLAATSLTTGAVNGDINDYEQFSASANFSNGTFTSTDRIVIKYYANMLGGSGSAYDFQFGGTSPVRTLLPVPVSVIPTPLASAIITDVSNFNGILSSANGNVQSALETIDDHNHDNRYYTETESDSRYVNVTGDAMTGGLTIGGNVGIGTTSPSAPLEVRGVNFPVTKSVRAPAFTNGVGMPYQALTVASSDMIDGFGTGYQFSIMDNAGTENEIARLVAYRKGADNSGAVGIYTNNAGSLTEKFTVLPNGNIGIGTTSPTQKLHVAGAINAEAQLTWYNGNADINGADTNLKFRTYNGSALVENMRITNTGNVGIGTTSPIDKLTINGNLTVGTSGYIRADSLNGGTGGAIKLNASNTAADQYIAFGVNVSGSAINFTERMRLTTDGKLGIGTSTPDTKLHVVGDTKIVGNLTVDGTTTTINTDEVNIADNIIKLNSDLVAQSTPGTVEGQSSSTNTSGGVEIKRYEWSTEFNQWSEAPYYFMFDEPSSLFKIGEITNLQAVATRQDVPTSNGIAYWNNVDKRFDTNSTVLINPAGIGNVPLTVSTISGTLVNMQEWRANGILRGAIDNDGGRFRTLGGLSNLTNFNSALVNPADNGTVISRNIADANNALTVNLANASSTGKIQTWQFAGADKAVLSNGGYLGLTGIHNLSSINNALVQTPSTGVLVQRNIADANTALTVNQENASSTGDVVRFQKAGSNVAYISQYGQIFGAGLYNLASGNNGYIYMADTGITAQRNVADANSALKVNQNHANSTGALIEAQFVGATKFSVSNNGNMYAAGINNTTLGGNSRVQLTTTGTRIAREIADANTALTVDQNNSSSTGNIANFQFNGTTKTAITKDGWIGIGTATPSTNLHIKGSAANLTLDRDTNTYGAGLILAENGVTKWTLKDDLGGENLNKLQIATADGNIRTTWLQDGKVGIGNTNPAYALDVTGDVNVTGAFRVNGTALSNVVDGTGTANTIPYWVDSNTLGSLATGTYPTLGELSYVKGLVGSAQAQIYNRIPYDDTLMPTNTFGGKKLYINHTDNAFFASDKKFVITATRHNVSDGGFTYPRLNPDYRDTYTVTTSSPTTRQITTTPYPAEVTVFENDTLKYYTTHYTYNATTGLITFTYTPSGTIYVYPGPTVPQYLDSPVVSTLSDTSMFFDGSYETNATVANGQYMKIKMTVDGTNYGNFATALGTYTYGEMYASYYFTGTPTTTYYRVYNYSYRPHTPGWKMTEFSDYVNNKSSSAYIAKVADQLNHGRSIMEIIVVGHDTSGGAYVTSLSQLDYKMQRPNLSVSGSTVTKFGANKLYYPMNFGDRTTNKVTLDPTGTITTTGLITGGQVKSLGNLTVESAYPRIYLTDTNNNSDYSIINSDGMFVVYDDTNSAPRLISTAGGNIGIGQWNASHKLDVAGNVNVSTGSQYLINGVQHTHTVSDITGVLPIANGGTGNSTKAGAFDNLAPTTTTGDIIYYDGTDNVRLPIGTTDQVLRVNAGIPQWYTPSSAAYSGPTKTLLGTRTATTSGTLTVSDLDSYDEIRVEVYVATGTGSYATPTLGTNHAVQSTRDALSYVSDSMFDIGEQNGIGVYCGSSQTSSTGLYVNVKQYNDAGTSVYVTVSGTATNLKTVKVYGINW